MATPTRENFICPMIVSRFASSLPAPIFNRCRLLRLRSTYGCAFVPIRSMQFQAVVAEREVLFVDHHGGYGVEDGIGGRLVALAWQVPLATSLGSLTAPVTVEIVGYRSDFMEIHRRIMSEFPAALGASGEKVAPAEAGTRIRVYGGIEIPERRE